MKFGIVSTRARSSRAFQMFSAVALVVSLAACGGGGLSADPLANVLEMAKPASPGNSSTAKGQNKTDTVVATTDPTTTTTTTDPATTTSTTPTDTISSTTT